LAQLSEYGAGLDPPPVCGLKELPPDPLAERMQGGEPPA
jgi:hypothetical protein